MNIEELGDLSEQARASLKVAAPVEKLELKCTGHEPFVGCGIEYKQGEVLVQFCNTLAVSQLEISVCNSSQYLRRGMSLE